MRKVLKVLGVLFVLFLAALVAIPFLVDVDKYRPQIVQIANDNLNGKLELGRLKLSLWGQIRIDVDGFSLSDARGNRVVSSKDVYFHLPFLPLLSGSPVLTFKTVKPEVFVVKDKAGKMNVLSLMKPAATPAEKAAEPAKPSTPTELPSIATRARLGVELRDALVSYKDEATALVTQIKDLNVVAKNISLSKPLDLEIWADLDTRMGKTMQLKGPARIKAMVDPRFEGSQFKQALAEFKVDLDKVAISVPGSFEKKSGQATHIDGKLQASTEEAKIERLVMRLHTAEIAVTGAATQLSQTPELAFDVKSNEIELKDWWDLVPALKANQVAAKVSLAVKIGTDKIESLVFKLAAPGNDLKIAGSLVGFAHPNASFSITSTGLDLDQLMNLPAAKPGETKTAAAAPKAETKPAADMDAMLDPLRENPMLAAMVAKIAFNLSLVKAKGVIVKPIIGSMSFRDLTFAVDSFRMGVFGANIKSTMSVAMRPKQPTYKFGAEIDKLDLQQAVASQLELFKNTVLGKASFKISGTGASFNPEPAKSNLAASGNLKIEKPTFVSLDIGRMATEAINKSLGEIGNKVPPLKGKQLSIPDAKQARYALIQSDFTIAKGVFSAPNFQAIAEPNAGIDVKGATTLGLKDDSLRAEWELVDTYNQTKARDLGVDSNGVRVEHILADGNNPVRFPITVTGTLGAPQTNYGKVPEALGAVALKNVTNAVAGKVKAEVQKKVENEVRKALPPSVQKAVDAPVQNAVQDLGKKLFGN